MYGFYGRYLKINLTEKKFDFIFLDDKTLSRWPGGKALASYLLYLMNTEGVDPLSPDNCLIFATGPVTGSMIWGSSRYGVFTKSPQTGLYSESYAGGKVPEAIDSAGFDAIVITGKNEKPSVLVINPEGVEFYDAYDLWGMDTHKTEDAVNKKYGSKSNKATKSGAVVIGPAGENLVRFAVIENDYWRSAGRTGVGTVMGSKNVKAIVFKGDQKRKLFDANRVKEFAKQVATRSKTDPGVMAYKSMGTPMMVETLNKVNAFPTRYWSKGYCEGWENIGAKALHTRCKVKPNACARCFIACGRMTEILTGRHAGLHLEGPEYETIFAFGGLCLIDSIEEIAYLNDICDRLGMDTISAGNLCGFTIEAVRNKRVRYPVDYGDADAIARLLNDIAKRQGIGDILANGIRFAAEKWDMEDVAVHVKGLELPGYDPRVLKGSGLAFATADRGACHLRATFHNPELKGLIDPEVVNGKAELFVDFEDRLTLMDTLILCRFYRDMYPWQQLEQIIEITTGLQYNRRALQKTASKISNLVRCFNIREGFRPEEESLPKRLFKEILQSGHRIKESELKIMLKDYYQLRGWNNNGIPKALPE